MRFDLLLVLLGNDRNAFITGPAETRNMAEKISKRLIVTEYIANAARELTNSDDDAADWSHAAEAEKTPRGRKEAQRVTQTKALRRRPSYTRFV
jgi:hypothetical protein